MHANFKYSILSRICKAQNSKSHLKLLPPNYSPSYSTIYHASDYFQIKFFFDFHDPNVFPFFFLCIVIFLLNRSRALEFDFNASCTVCFHKTPISTGSELRLPFQDVPLCFCISISISITSLHLSSGGNRSLARCAFRIPFLCPVPSVSAILGTDAGISIPGPRMVKETY